MKICYRILYLNSFFKYQAYLLNQLFLLEAEVPTFGDNNMVQDTDTHNFTGFA